MLIYLIITSFLLLLYAGIMLLYRYWFVKLQPFNLDASILPVTNFTIVIPARNEEANIGKCLHSILTQDYPSSLFEIIVIDDYSTDSTPSIIQQFQVNYSNIK